MLAPKKLVYLFLEKFDLNYCYEVTNFMAE